MSSAVAADHRGVIIESDEEPSIAPAKGRSHAEGKTRIRNGAGNSLHTIHLRENIVKNNKKNAQAEPEPRRAADERNRDDFRGWHRKEVRFLTKELEQDYKFEAIAMTSWIGSTISAYLADETADALARDERVYEVVEHAKEDQPQFSALWFDSTQGGEIIPWGKQAIGTNDLLTSTNTIYMIDRTPEPHIDLTINTSPANSPGAWNQKDHGTFIAGVVAAKNNGQFVRGINPAATNFWSVEIASQGVVDVMNAIDWTLGHSEENGQRGVINFSSNAQDLFKYDNAFGKLLRRASNRSLVVQSAGNNLASACSYAYCSALAHNYYDELTQNPVDGIVVVGGINDSGALDQPFDNPSVNSVFGSQPGSNYGHCVEMWAPSTTKSLAVINGVQTMITAKGTSFAAPHVAALAARYGTSATTPVQREAYLRSVLVPTGSVDIDARAIKVPTFTAAPVGVIPTRLTVSAISASSSTPGSVLASTQDGLHLSGNYWNAGSTAGWIQFDLGSSKNIRSVRLIPEQSAGGQVKHEIWVGDSPSALSKIRTIQEFAEILSPIAYPLPSNTSARYVRIQSNLAGISWVSWREVEIYGN